MEIICFAVWFWLTVLGAFVALIGEIIKVPGYLLVELGARIADFAERFK
jgi:hypothetical protein